MNEEVQSWLSLADADWLAAQRLTGGGTDAALCFQLQPCIEKLFKANLVARKIRPAHTHNLMDLSATLADADPSWTWDKEELRFLTRGAVEMRYYIEDAASLAEEAKLALSLAQTLRTALTKLLGSI